MNQVSFICFIASNIIFIHPEPIYCNKLEDYIDSIKQMHNLLSELTRFRMVPLQVKCVNKGLFV